MDGSRSDIAIVERSHALSDAEKAQTCQDTHWLGWPVRKCPLDLWIYQELIHELRPDLIIETGTNGGGSALFFASLCDVLGHGEVVTVNQRPQPDLPEHPRITYLMGSSVDLDVVGRVRQRADTARTILVGLDSSHQQNHVLAELELYGPLVTPGSYLVVEGAHGNGNPVLPDFGPGPGESVRTFLRSHPEFAPDPTREKFTLTSNSGGWLKRLDTPVSLASDANRSRTANQLQDSVDLYLDLMKKCLTRTLFDLGPRFDRRTSQIVPTTAEMRTEGRDWPAEAETMIGLLRLDNIQHCVSEVLRHNVPGDLIETGVWRGGATIFMRAALKAYGDTERTVWVADSFQGLPEPDVERYPVDASKFHQHEYLAISVEEVKANFDRYGLLDNQVRFLAGWFNQTLPGAAIDRLSVLRLDGDLYESTMDALTSLYPKLSVGGYLIVDDYGVLPGCRQAVEDYRSQHGIDEPVEQIDWTGVFWQRQK